MQTNQPNFPPNAISTKKNTIILTRKHGKGKRATHEQEAQEQSLKTKKKGHANRKFQNDKMKKQKN